MKLRNKLYTITASTLLASIPTIANAENNSFSETLNTILTQYCVPQSGTNCNPNEVATYNKTTGLCDCTEGNVWVADQRQCVVPVECPAGYKREKYEGQN